MHKRNTKHGQALCLTSADQEEERKPIHIFIKQTEIDLGGPCLSLLAQRQHFGHLRFLKFSVKDLTLYHGLCSNDFFFLWNEGRMMSFECHIPQQSHRSFLSCELV